MSANRSLSGPSARNSRRTRSGAALACGAAGLAARRMREARTLLLGGRGVAEVAREVGYRSPTSFSAAFAKAFGMSPSQFKDRSAMAVVNVASETNRQALPKVGRHGDRRRIR